MAAAGTVLTFTYRSFDGCVPDPVDVDEANPVLLENRRNAANHGRTDIRLSFWEAIRAAMTLAQKPTAISRRNPHGKSSRPINRRLRFSVCSPYCHFGLENGIYPFLPFSSQKLHIWGLRKSGG